MAKKSMPTSDMRTGGGHVYPGDARAMTDIGKERGWPSMTRVSFDAQLGPKSAVLIGRPHELVDKILGPRRWAASLGSRLR